MNADASGDWKRWHEHREETVSAPYGPLALVGSHWIEDHPDGRLPAVPGSWAVDGDGVRLTATAADGLALDGAPFAGEVLLTADREPSARVTHGGRRLVVLVREGVWGVRDYDPAAATRRAFRGIDATPYDPRWSVPGRFTPYDDDPRTVRVGTADGVERALVLAGELGFTVAGRELTLQVAEQADGRLWAVFADATSGAGSFRFRFLYSAAPDADGSTVVDFNRAQLPQCAFADHFICPFPPPGNTLDLPVEAGERRLA
ncbi:DUF1684 domain-containing protein [Streptomyces fuscichromogenes]|uniref:DUF1684 domain-containing protein n=1 Tax=Streptomyces fuscichromogenes TaxID=1324013 RepID=A0A917XNE0_9ACTN|nr:DUF1684 domain-containing protein [Streptomyces fuscichromogenes]GGN43207.1 hypothetical protein GCM10011578_093210 [Streptomyces fuscichromogenes]